MTGSLEKSTPIGTGNYVFKHTLTLITPGTNSEGSGAKGIHNNQKKYAVVFFVKFKNDIISIDTVVEQVKENKDNTYIFKKTIVIKNVIVKQKYSVNTLINDTLNSNFSRIQLPSLPYILSLIPGPSRGIKAPVPADAYFKPAASQTIKGQPCYYCGSS
jgi:hypothetical protein